LLYYPGYEVHVVKYSNIVLLLRPPIFGSKDNWMGASHGTYSEIEI